MSCNHLNNGAVDLSITPSATHFWVYLPIGELTGLGMEGERPVRGLRYMVNVSLECVHSPDIDKAAKDRASHIQLLCDSVTGLRFSRSLMGVTTL